MTFFPEAAEAADFYVANFPGARLLGGSPLVVSVQVGGLKLSLLNGGPQFKVNPSISLFYNCDNEAEINALWGTLSKGGSVLMPLDDYPFGSSSTRQPRLGRRSSRPSCSPRPAVGWPAP